VGKTRLFKRGIEIDPTFYLSNQGTGLDYLWKLIETAPTVADDTTGVKFAKGSVGYTLICPGVVNQSIESSLPAGLPVRAVGWITGVPLTGQFNAGTWTFNITLVTGKYVTGNLLAYVRLFKSPFWDGAQATALTDWIQIASITPSASTTYNLSGSASLGAITLNNEYLFVVYYLGTTSACGSAQGCTVTFRCNGGANQSIVTPTFVPTIILESIETDGSTTNKGTIIFDGVEYSLPASITKSAGTYTAQYNPASGYLFDYWESSESISISNPLANPTSVTFTWGGILKAVYATPLPVGWSYRKSHVINPASGAGMNYPIRIKVHYGSGIDSGEDVYLNGKCRTDFGDIRFTRSNGSIPLNYWMEEKVDGDYAIFWVRIVDDLSTNPVTIYIYYGNPTATSISNQILTGIAQLKEHKNYSAYNPDISFVKPTATEVRMDSYTAGATPMGEAFVFFIVPASWINGKYIRWKWDGYFSYTEARGVADSYILDGAYDRKSDTDFPSGAGMPLKGNGNLQVLYQENTYGTWGPFARDVLVSISPALDYVTLFFHLTDGWNTQTVYDDIDLIEVNNESGGSKNIIRLHFTESVIMEVTGTYNDYGLFRKYVSPEPSHGAWGSEETIGIIETIIAKPFPMLYLAKPIKAQELISKVEGATITTIAKDFPEILIKKGKAQELKSKFG